MSFVDKKKSDIESIQNVDFMGGRRLKFTLVKLSLVS